MNARWTAAAALAGGIVGLAFGWVGSGRSQPLMAHNVERLEVAEKLTRNYALIPAATDSPAPALYVPPPPPTGESPARAAVLSTAACEALTVVSSEVRSLSQRPDTMSGLLVETTWGWKATVRNDSDHEAACLIYARLADNAGHSATRMSSLRILVPPHASRKLRGRLAVDDANARTMQPKAAASHIDKVDLIFSERGRLKQWEKDDAWEKATGVPITNSGVTRAF